MNAPRSYIIGIAGTGTGALAGLLQAAGHQVTGSDSHIYPPMRDKLAEWKIPVLAGYDAEHLATLAGGPPDNLIVGNVVRKDNPEAVYARAHNLRSMSMPEALAEMAIGDRHSLVVAGTHGKTTTTALLAHVLRAAGLDPGFLVGGALVGLRDSFCLGSGPHFVVEGDEYDTAYFDKRSKFLHYRGRTVIITSLEFDHADIFADVAAVESTFAALIASVPPEGCLVVWQGASRALALCAQHARCPVVVYDDSAPGPQAAAAVPMGNGWSRLVATDVVLGPEGIRFRLQQASPAAAPPPPANDADFQLRLWGAFSVQNALAVVAAARAAGLNDAQIASGMQSFQGVQRRMQVVDEGMGVTLVDDFAHHPTAVAVTLAAARSRWPGRRLWAIFEPRSATSRRNVFMAEYTAAFAAADAIVVAHHPRLGEVPLPQRFSPAALAEALRQRGRLAEDCADTQAIVTFVTLNAQAGDVVLVLSNGDFDGLLPKLRHALAARAGRARQAEAAP